MGASCSDTGADGKWSASLLGFTISGVSSFAIRYKYHAGNYRAFVQFACILILLRQVSNGF
jgi:hypothetical protein